MNNGDAATKKAAFAPDVPSRPTWLGHLQIARVDHWFKNVFVLPGIVVALGMSGWHTSGLALRVLLGFVSVCLIASSNYVINEVLDAPYDRQHEVKHNRPVPAGRVHIPLAYVEWIALMSAGLLVAARVSNGLLLTMVALWVMGCVYNIPPIRSKDVPYLDVLTESVNNPLRLLAGWFIVDPPGWVPASLLLSYWMIGCYFMAIKRFSEFREFPSEAAAVAYRRSFAFYTEQRLLISIMFYASASMLFFGAFTIRYRMELVLSFPLVALVMSAYLAMAFQHNSPVQNPEKLYRNSRFMAVVFACSLVMVFSLIYDMPEMHSWFAPRVSTPGNSLQGR